jgi:hypothetical protein
MSLKKQKIAILICLSLLLVAPLLAYAHGLVPCGGINENPCTVEDVFVIIARVTNWLIFVAGIYAVYEIVNNGFWMVASMGNEEAITKRKSGLANAVMGFVLVMAAYILINTAVNSILLGSLPAGSPLKVDLTNPLKYLSN